jgi:hypothetical protein
MKVLVTGCLTILEYIQTIWCSLLIGMFGLSHSLKYFWFSYNCGYCCMFCILLFNSVSYVLLLLCMNNASLLFHGASWHWSGHVVGAIAQAHTAGSSRSPYGILLRSHFVSHNKNFRCAYFSMQFRIKFLLFNDVCSVMYILFSSCQLALFGYPDWGFSVHFPQL